ncbi:endopeptidase [Enterobacteriaceae bacterium 4M9]|nr:endopeptidase [Enterobacteriaceae bacterium 4M9]
MSPGWIRIDAITPDKPEVYLISEILNIDPDAVLGKLVRLWLWADMQTIKGNASCITHHLVDRVVLMPGFADALIQAGWLHENHCCLSLPNFERYNPTSSKERALRKYLSTSPRYGDATVCTRSDVPDPKALRFIE